MSTLKDELQALLKVEGIQIAVVVSRDGFVIDGAVTEEGGPDLEAVGAVVSASLAASASIGGELSLGAATQSMLEFENGIVVACDAGPSAVLAVVAAGKANLGNIRYQVRKRIQALVEAL